MIVSGSHISRQKYVALQKFHVASWPRVESELRAFTSASKAQHEIVDYLREKVGRNVATPDPSKTDLNTRQRARYDVLSDQEKPVVKDVYTTLLEDVLIAQQLLKTNSAAERIRVLDLIHSTITRGTTTLQRAGKPDYWLAARLQEAFILPNVQFGKPFSWAARSAYRTMVRLLIRLQLPLTLFQIIYRNRVLIFFGSTRQITGLLGNQREHQAIKPT